MIIEIDDDLSPEKRRELLRTLPIKYAISKTGTMCAAAKFLGFSDRYVRNIVKEYDYITTDESELKDMYCDDRFDSDNWGKYDRRS